MKLAVLCGRGDTSAAVINHLQIEFGNFPILMETRESRRKFLKRRAKKLGYLKVFGQVAFMLLAVPLLRRKSMRRYQHIVRCEGLNLSQEVFANAIQVESANGANVEAWLREYEPDIVIVNGTRIIAKRILDASNATFINIHCGITPSYRGTHGGYWARVHQDSKRCGVTVHLVDPGVDTGKIYGQKLIEPNNSDNIVTYPLLQVAAALPVLVDAIKGKMSTSVPEGKSEMWFHPTLWEYLFFGLKKGVW
jgi:folate-dependent phosphoribosylglycinamide formyltransferase PurN